MHTYQCETCNITVEIEEIDATLYPPEYYEHSQCQDCFERSLKEDQKKEFTRKQHGERKMEMEQGKEELYTFVMKRQGEVVGGQSQFLYESEVDKYINNYKRAYQANEVFVYAFNKYNSFQLHQFSS